MKDGFSTSIIILLAIAIMGMFVWYGWKSSHCDGVLVRGVVGLECIEKRIGKG